jgi:hypothetical protein
MARSKDRPRHANLAPDLGLSFSDLERKFVETIEIADLVPEIRFNEKR